MTMALMTSNLYDCAHAIVLQRIFVSGVSACVR